MTQVRVLILTGYGLNCDNETAYAFEKAGGRAEKVHINSLIDGTVGLEDYQIMVFGGGFSWGDDHGAGVIQAVRMKMNLGEKILGFVEKGNLVLGICNGFQALVNMGLLPGLNKDYQKRSVAITFNDSGNFRDQWTRLKVNPQSPCVFTTGLDMLEFPIRHGEGKFYAADDVIAELSVQNQVVIQYADRDGRPAQGKFPDNPNGSIGDIAGICDPSGRVFGLMPHPEAFNHVTNHPDWNFHRERGKRVKTEGDFDLVLGTRLFKNAIDHVR